MSRDQKTDETRLVAEKLQVIRIAAQNAFPVNDIDQMLAEIENGYLPPASPETDA
jgi:hypothetical protein